MTDPVLLAALATDAPYVFGAIEVTFPDYTLRLLDGSAEIMIDGQLFVGQDPVFGVIDTIGGLQDSIGDEAPQLEFGILPPSATAAAVLANGLMQGSPVRILMGVVDPATNTLIGVPEVVFTGEIDVPTLTISKGARAVSYTVTTVLERLFEVAEGERASDGWLQSIWPGARGLEYVTGTDKNLYWMAKRPVPQYIKGGVSFLPNWEINPAWGGV